MVSSRIEEFSYNRESFGYVRRSVSSPYQLAYHSFAYSTSFDCRRAHPSSTSSAKAPYVVKAGKFIFYVSLDSQIISFSYLLPTCTTIVPLFQILPLPNDTAHFDVFNDLALEWIPEEKLLALNEDFWNFVPLDPGVRAEERRKNSVSKKEDKQALKEQEKTL